MRCLSQDIRALRQFEFSDARTHDNFIYTNTREGWFFSAYEAEVGRTPTRPPVPEALDTAHLDRKKFKYWLPAQCAGSQSPGSCRR
jgi:hypothetical protein